MIHPDTEVRPVSKLIGLGVFATRRMPRGTILWVLDALDQRLSPDRVAALGSSYAEHLDRYGFLDRHGDRILCWDSGCFVNHACDPNSLPTPWGLEIALRDIEAGEEITNDYAALNLEQSFECACARPACRKTIRPSDFERLLGCWDAQLRAAAPAIPAVDQPLWNLVQSPDDVVSQLRRPAELPSLMSLRCPAARRDPSRLSALALSIRPPFDRLR